MTVGPATNRFMAAIGVRTESLVDDSDCDSRQALVYLFFLKISFSRLPASVFADLLPGVGGPSTLPFERGLNLLGAIARCVKSKPRASIDHIATTLKEDGILCDSALSLPERRNHTRQMIFWMLSLLHSLYKPKWSDAKSEHYRARFSIDSEGANCMLQDSLPLDTSERPLEQLRLGFGLILPRKSDLAESSAAKATLYVSFLNAATLRNFGIEIVWVYTMSSHLDFDQSRQKLCLFYLPSLCQLHSFSNDSVMTT